MDKKEFERKSLENKLCLQALKNEYLKTNAKLKVEDRVKRAGRPEDIYTVKEVILEEFPTTIFYIVEDEGGREHKWEESLLRLYVKSNKMSLLNRFMRDLQAILIGDGSEEFNLSDLLFAIDRFEAPLRYARHGKKGELIFWDIDDRKSKAFYDLKLDLDEQSNEFYAFMCSFLEHSDKVEDLDKFYDSYKEIMK